MLQNSYSEAKPKAGIRAEHSETTSLTLSVLWRDRSASELPKPVTELTEWTDAVLYAKTKQIFVSTDGFSSFTLLIPTEFSSFFSSFSWKNSESSKGTALDPTTPASRPLFSCQICRRGQHRVQAIPACPSAELGAIAGRGKPAAPAPRAPEGLTASHELRRCPEARSGRAVLLHAKMKGTEKLANYRIHPTFPKGGSKPSSPAWHPEQQSGNIAGRGTGRPAGLRSAAPTYRRGSSAAAARAGPRGWGGVWGAAPLTGSSRGASPLGVRDGAGGEGRGQRAAAGCRGAPWWAAGAAPTSTGTRRGKNWWWPAAVFDPIQTAWALLL